MTANLENSSVWAAGLWCEGPTSKIMKQTDAITVEWIVHLDVAQSCLGMKDLCICTYIINVPKDHLSIDGNKHIKQKYRNYTIIGNKYFDRTNQSSSGQMKTVEHEIRLLYATKS